MTDPTEYACTLKGLALFALDQWKYNESIAKTASGDEQAIAIGRNQAYAGILRQITGHIDTVVQPATWEEAIAAMEGGAR
jgi:hypothetical protein